MMNTKSSASATNGNRWRSENQLGVKVIEYCKAIPDTPEWHTYQIQRVRSLRELKMKQLATEEQISAIANAILHNRTKEKKYHDPKITASSKISVSQAHPQTRRKSTILKKLTKETTANSQTRDASNVTWKEPLADMKFLPVSWMKVPDVLPTHHQARTRSREKLLIRKKITSAEKSVRRMSVADSVGKQLFVTERSGKNGKPHKRNDGKNNLHKPITTAKLEDTSTIAVKGRGKLNNTKTNKMSSENPSKPDSRMSITAMKSHSGATLPTGVTTSGKSYHEQTLRQRKSASVSSQNGSNISVTKETVDVGVAPAEIVHNQAVDKNNIPEENTTSSAIDINHGNSCTVVDVPARKRNGSSIIGSISKEDLNGNATIFEFTQHQLKNVDATIASAKRYLGVGIDASEQVNSWNLDYPSPSSAHAGVEMNANGGKNTQHVSKQLAAQADLEHREYWKSAILDKNGNASSTLDRYRYGPKPEKKSVTFETLESLLNRFKPPELPELEVCNVLPGTPEWRKYWEDFNQKIGEYYSSVERYSRQMDDLLVDEDGSDYMEQLKRRHQDETILKLSMGISMSKPPLIREPLRDTIEVGGYVIRSLGGVIAQATVSTSDHNSFRLEVPCASLSTNFDAITVDEKYNIMTIAIPSDQKGSPFMKLVQISVPKYKKVRNLEIGNPLDNGGKIIVTGR